MATKMSFEKQFVIYVKSAFALLAVQTIEVDRVTEVLHKLTQNFIEKIMPKLQLRPEEEHLLKPGAFQFRIWDHVNGWYKPEPSDEDPFAIKKEKGSDGVINGLRWLLESQQAGIYVMQNIHLKFYDQIDYPLIMDYLKKIAEQGKNTHQHLFLVGDMTEVPVQIRPHTVSLDFPLPSRDDLETFMAAYVKNSNLKTIKKEEISAAADAAAGLTMAEAEAALCVSLVESGGTQIDRSVIFEEKTKLVRRVGFLEHIPATLDIKEDVGGFDIAKTLFNAVATAFINHKKAKEYHLPVPRGCLITGVSGAGKSLISKTIAALFGVEFYRWDVGTVFGGLVGDSERNTREVFKLMRALAPCVIQLEEIEQTLGISGSGDHEVTKRLRAAFLTFMQEKTEPIYIIATCNNVSGLPPEMLRAGRWDHLLFADLPDEQERQDIFKIKIRQSGRDPKEYKGIPDLAKKSNNFSGAEIERCVHQAMSVAFADNFREYTTKDILQAVLSTVPLAVTKEKEIKELRAWGAANAKPASSRSAFAKTAGVKSGPFFTELESARKSRDDS